MTTPQPNALPARLQSLIDDLRAEAEACAESADVLGHDADTLAYAAERIEYVLLLTEEGVAW